MILEFKNGLTVKELKAIIKDWPEVNECTNEDCEVWIETGQNSSSIVKTVSTLNQYMGHDDNTYADIIFGVNKQEI